MVQFQGIFWCFQNIFYQAKQGTILKFKMSRTHQNISWHIYNQKLLVLVFITYFDQSKLYNEKVM